MSSEPQQKFIIDIPVEFDEVERQKIAELSVQRIVARTDVGIDKTGKRFSPYSASYVNSLDFKIAGKNRNEVNLQLTGDMINSLQILESKPGKIILGYNEGTIENDKAAWAAASDNGPSRKFLGLKPEELELILAEVRMSRPKTLSGLAKQEMTLREKNKTQKQLIDKLLQNFYLDTGD